MNKYIICICIRSGKQTILCVSRCPQEIVKLTFLLPTFAFSCWMFNLCACAAFVGCGPRKAFHVDFVLQPHSVLSSLLLFCAPPANRKKYRCSLWLSSFQQSRKTEKNRLLCLFYSFRTFMNYSRINDTNTHKRLALRDRRKKKNPLIRGGIAWPASRWKTTQIKHENISSTKTMTWQLAKILSFPASSLIEIFTFNHNTCTAHTQNIHLITSY